MTWAKSAGFIPVLLFQTRTGLQRKPSAWGQPDWKSTTKTSEKTRTALALLAVCPAAGSWENSSGQTATPRPSCWPQGQATAGTTCEELKDWKWRSAQNSLKNSLTSLRKKKKKVSKNSYNPGLHPKRQLKEKGTVGTRAWIAEMNEGNSRLAAANLLVFMTLKLHCINKGKVSKGLAS